MSIEAIFGGARSKALVSLLVALMIVLPEIFVFVGIIIVGFRFKKYGLSIPEALPVLLISVGLLLWAVPSLFGRDSASNIVESFAQAAAVAITLYAFYRFGATRQYRKAIVIGAMIGVAVLAAISFIQIAFPVASPMNRAVFAMLGRDALSFPGRALGWTIHPNLWAAHALLPPLIVLQLSPSLLQRLSSLTLALVVILASGSRTALIAFAVGVVWWLLVELRARKIIRPWKTALGLSSLLFLGLLWSSYSDYGERFQLGSLLRSTLGTSGVGSINLLRSSEDIDDDPVIWKLDGVEVHRSMDVQAEQETSASSVWTIKKVAEAPSAQVYQRVQLAPAEDYILSAEIQSLSGATVPGISAWGRRTEDVVQSSLNILRQTTGWNVYATNELDVVSSEFVDLGNSWTALVVRFRLLGSSPLVVRLGPTPDQTPSETGQSMSVRKLQLAIGAEPTAYEATTKKERVDAIAVSAMRNRLQLYQLAWDGILQRPLVGAGTGRVPERVRVLGSHFHNLFLQTTYERGAVGLVGIVLLLVGLVLLRPLAGLALVFPVVILNLADNLFWYAPIALCLSAAMGYLAGEHDKDHV